MSHFYRYDIRHVCACLLWLMLTACSHDARRENLLDPDLTPPVVLQAELSHSTGAVRLTWSPYEGHQPFASYLLLRRVGSDITVDTLQTLVDRDSTAAVDTSLTPGTSYEYRVAVTNTGGLLVPSAAVTIAGFTVGAVTLLPIKVDASAGVINLQWTSFSDPGFVQYRVTRHLVGTDVDTTLFAGNDIADTTFVDTTASHGLVYSYSVATEASGQILISNADDTVLRHPPVTVLDPVFDSATASARLTWRAYSGARFYQYDVQRRTRELAYTTVGTTSDLADTTWQDTELRGATEYTYRVVVVTSRQEQVVSDEVQGGIHLLVATWDLGGLTKQPGIRLSRRPDDGRVEALLSFGDEFLRITPLVVGEPLAAVELLPNLAAEPLGFAMAAAVTDGGERIVVRNRKRDRHAATLVSAFDANERLIWRDTSLELPIPPGHQASGELALLKGFYRGLRLLSAGLEALHDDFSVLPEAEVTGTFGPWDVVNSHLALGVWAHIHQPGSMIVRDAAWSQLALQTQFTVDSAGTELRLGTDDTGHLLFFMTSPPLSCRCPDNGEVSLGWVTPAATDGDAATVLTTAGSINLEGSLDVVELTLESADGVARASLRIAELVARQYSQEQPPVLCAAANVGGALIVTVDDTSFVATMDGRLGEARPLPGRVGELRVWEGRRSRQVGMCLPDEDLVLYGDLRAGAEWSGSVNRTIGPTAGRPSSFLVSPISFDAGADERLYVLDAGNGRIVVFDVGRRYVTEWGGWGSDPGEFKFGGGASLRSNQTGFFGSVAVDGDGYIYVADEINRRIQAFAP